MHFFWGHSGSMVIYLNSKWLMLLPIAPLALFLKKFQKGHSAADVPTAPTPHPLLDQESLMSTAPITPPLPVVPIPPAKHNAFVRFIDAVGHDVVAVGHVFVKAEPILEDAAVAAEPFLALSPAGPEYALVVNAILGAKKTAVDSLAAGVTLTGPQKMAQVIQATTPALDAILTSKGVTTDTQAHIAEWAQLIFDLLAGPAGQKLVSDVAKA